MYFWFAASISQSAYGGIHRSMNFLAGELRRYGHVTHIFYARPGSERYKLRFSLLLALKMVFTLWRRPQWIIARSSDGIFCALVARILHLKIRVALHNHGWEERVFELERRLPTTFVNNPTTWRGRVFGFALLRLTLKYSHLCICGTLNEARWIKKKHIGKRVRIIVIPNGVDTDNKKESYWCRQPERPPSFLMVGGFTWKKNLEYGIELFRRFLEGEPASRLFIVGCGVPDESKRRLLFPLGDAVFTVESESPEKMMRWYDTCPMLLFPSRYEGGRPFTVLEAQSRGCIVFATDIPSLNECVNHGNNGFILSGINPVADVELIHKVYTNGELMNTIGRAARRKADRNRSLRQGRRLIKVLLSETLGRK